MEHHTPTPLPHIHWLIALIPFVALVALQIVVISIFGSDALDGASQTVLLFASAVGVMIAMVGYKVPWKSIEEAIVQNIKTVGIAIVILFLIGAVSGSWMLSGVVPTMIYYGMKIVSPSVFLFITCLLCALVSLVTGSSWTTVATIGIALMGIGTAHGYSMGWTAGAIISEPTSATRFHRSPTPQCWPLPSARCRCSSTSATCSSPQYPHSSSH